ncbi:MAG: hypothetical protein AB1489_12630 [Acidobacteriota bacterium]
MTKRNIVRVCLTVMLFFATLGIMTNQAMTSSKELDLVLITDRDVYHVGQPVRLTMEVHNVSKETIVGEYSLSLSNFKLRIYYRRVGEQFEKYSCGAQERPVGIGLPIKLSAGGGLAT